MLSMLHSLPVLFVEQAIDDASPDAVMFLCVAVLVATLFISVLSVKSEENEKENKNGGNK